jgi:PAS domain S-box-containing protein
MKIFNCFLFGIICFFFLATPTLNAKSLTEKTSDTLTLTLQSLAASKHSGNYALQVKLNRSVGSIYLRLDQPLEAIPFFKAGLLVADKLKDWDACLLLRFALGDSYFELGKMDSALFFYEENLSFCQKRNFKDREGECLLRMAKTYLYSGSYDRSLDLYFEALQIFESSNNTLGVAKVHKDLGLLYINLGNNLQAMSFLERSLKVITLTDDQISKAEIIYRIGVAKERLKEYQSALSYFDKAKNIYASTGNYRKAAYVERARGRVFFRMADIKVAIQITGGALKVFEKYHYNWGIIEACNDLGVFCAKQGDYRKAENYLFRALDLSQKLNSSTLIKDTYLHISELYSTKKDYKNALYYYRISKAINDSVLINEKIARLGGLQSKFESDKKESEIQRKNDVIVKNVATIKKQKVHIYLIGVALVLILLFLSFIYRQYIKLERKGHQFERINAELDQRVKDRTSALRLTQFSIEQAVDPIFWIDWSGRFVYVNNAACVNLMFSKEDLMEKKINQIAPELSYDVWNEYWEVVRKEGSLVIETFFRRKDLSRFPVEILLNYIMHERTEYAFAFVHDISDRKNKEENLRKAKEKAEESDKLKSAFLANMSHEIRTPMNAIIGFSDMLVSRDFSEEEKDEFAQIIKSSGDTLLNLIDDIIDISLIEAGQLKTKVISINLYNSINDINKFFQSEKSRLKKDQVDIRIASLNMDQSIFIEADQTRFRQVLTNLIGNALKFTDEGYIETGIEVLDDKMVRIYVKDTGIGIPSEKLHLVFERFQKLDGENRIYGGTGLGLTISKKLVEQMNGDLTVTSEVDKGSVFSFIIPYHRENSELSGEVVLSNSSVKPTFNWSGRKVLIVEDVESNFKLLNNLLRRSGAVLHWAKNADEALACCQTIFPDIILMDIQLPGKNGYELTREILNLYPGLPIIAQTAFAFNDERQRILSAGCVDCLTKPINGDLLFSVMNKYLG